MKRLKALKSVLFVWLSCILLLAGCGINEIQPQSESLTSFEGVANYIKAHHELPENFITKNEAKKLGWDPQGGNLQEVAPGKSIGGDVFQNREKKLPYKKGRIWYEADINYTSGHRGKDRILFSNDGLIYKTENHYETFEQIK
ncbi:ribonuclease [Paenibacillus sp. HJL G12]|uniref:Ribonuclease n=1 Tax=Paenibacillus dendrobii TaxID=2691084 RepID=A0A7X3LGA7_9BACL|nr:ribonuclease domain-containing protein [Paenibacillus dendrobii]MWV43927.1 ribonuclease [Paenibacillus dendrobii]